MAYCDVDDVLARLGRLRPAVAQNSGADGSEITRLCEDVSGRFDAVFLSRGLTVPITDATALAALRPIVADGAALMTIDGLFPDANQGGTGSRLADRIERRYMADVKALEDGSSPIVKALEAELISGTSTGAGSLWQAEPLYDLLEPFEAMSISPSIRPPFSKVMKL